MSNPKRPNNKRTLEEKKAILDETANNSNRSALARQFGVPRTTIDDILSQKQSILSAIDGGSEAKRRQLTSGKHQQMEEALLRWHKQIRSQNVPVSGELLKEKALAIANKLEIVDFKASEACLTNFKGRHGIKFKTEQGEAGSVDVGSARDRCAGGKKSKQRITVLVCANMSGSQKSPLLMTVRLAKPRRFKNVNVPVEYEANKKAWMTEKELAKKIEVLNSLENEIEDALFTAIELRENVTAEATKMWSQKLDEEYKMLLESDIEVDVKPVPQERSRT